MHPDPQALLRSVFGFERFRGVEYLCPAGKPTIGYGHVILYGEAFAQPFTEAQASALLLEDCALAEIYINANVRVRLAQHEFDALVSFVFNIGVGAFDRSTMRRFLNLGDRAATANEFTRWDKVGKVPMLGLTRRRAAERAMFEGRAA